MDCPRLRSFAAVTLAVTRSIARLNLVALGAVLWFAACPRADATVYSKTWDTFPTIMELNINDTLNFTLSSGATRSIVILNKGVTTYNDLDTSKPAQWLIWADITVDGHPHRLLYQPFHIKALYEPKVIDGLRIGLETIKNYDATVGLKSGSQNAITYKDVRIWVNDATKPIVVSGTSPGTPAGLWFQLFQDRDGAPLVGGSTPPVWPQRPDYRIRLDRDVRGSTTVLSQLDDKTSWLGKSGNTSDAAVHTGLDFSVPELTELYGVVAGRVEYDPYDVGRFYYDLTRPNGDHWEFGSHHCDIASYGSVSGGHIVPMGSPVSVNQLWALSGDSGSAGGDPHLHAQIFFTPAGTSVSQVLNAWPYVWQGLENRKIADNVIRAQIQPVGPTGAWTTIAFSSAGSHPGQGRSALGYQWYFSDGSVSLQPNPSKSFPAGVHQAILVVDDGYMRDVQQVFFTVGTSSTNPAPTITLESWAKPAMPTVNQSTQFGVKATGNLGHALDYTWNFGDGSATLTTASPTVTHAFSGSGRFVVVVTVRDTVTQARSMDYFLLDTWQWPAAPAASTNVAKFKSASADSYLPGCPPSMAVDDNTSDANRWVSESTAVNHWVVIDLGATYTINHAEVETGYSTSVPIANFVLQSSWNNGASWSDIPGTRVTGNTSTFRSLSFNRISTSRIRLLSTDGTYVRVKELRLFTP